MMPSLVIPVNYPEQGNVGRFGISLNFCFRCAGFGVWWWKWVWPKVVIFPWSHQLWRFLGSKGLGVSTSRFLSRKRGENRLFRGRSWAGWFFTGDVHNFDQCTWWVSPRWLVSDIFCFHFLGEMIQFDEHIFQMGWFNHQPVQSHQISTMAFWDWDTSADISDEFTNFWGTAGICVIFNLECRFAKHMTVLFKNH